MNNKIKTLLTEIYEDYDEDNPTTLFEVYDNERKSAYILINAGYCELDDDRPEVIMTVMLSARGARKAKHILTKQAE